MVILLNLERRLNIILNQDKTFKKLDENTSNLMNSHGIGKEELEGGY